MNTISRQQKLSRTYLAVAVAAGLTLSSGVDAAALISQDLQARLATAPTHQVIITFSDPAQMSRLSTLLTPVRKLKELPMAGAILTSAQVQQVAGWDGVKSI